MTNIANYRQHPSYHFLEHRLWNDSLLSERSEELTIISIDRYYGPRKPGQHNAHPFWEMGCIVRGTIELICERSVLLGTDSVFLIPPSVAHSEKTDAPADIIWLSLRGSLLPSTLLDQPETITNHDLACMIEQLWIFAEIGETGCGPELDAKAKQIVARFFSIHQRRNCPDAADMVEKSITYLQQHISDPISIPDIASRMGCSQTYFRRLFKMRTGRTPIEYLLELRMRHAQSLLEHTDMSIAEVATSIGYDDPFYFSRLFSKTHGISPFKYRKLRCRGYSM